METHFDAYMKFPAISEYDLGTFDRLHKLLGSVEDIEQSFAIEFSCGDGKYFSDFWKWTESGEGLYAVGSDEELEKYDGQVCTDTPPRLNSIKMSMLPEQMKAGKDYRFTVKYNHKTEEQIFLINGKERNRLDIRR